MSTAAKPKVFCIGFQKTGTTTLETCLQILGYNVTSIFGKHTPVEQMRREFVAEGLRIASQVDAVQDMPWPLLYRELDTHYPGARFILTLRSEDAWWRSILGHFGSRVAPLQQLTYGDGHGAPLGNEALYRQVYRDHNRGVLAYFADRPGDLLVLDLSKEATWKPLCDFLGEDVPQVPFPHSQQRNEAASLKRTVRRLLARVHNRALQLRRAH